MKAVIFHGIDDIRLEDVKEPTIQHPSDAIIRLTASAICGTDLHFVRGTLRGMEPGTILGHEGVGIVEETGPAVRNLNLGDRVVVTSTIACGYCAYCRAGYFSQCDVANPKGRDAGTSFFGGPKDTGPVQGLQAERARIPFANVNLVKLPDNVSDDQAILISDIFPTGYFGADLASIHPGSIVSVFGCGPVGQFAIASSKLMGAGRILAIDNVQSRLDVAKAQGAEVINFDAEDPVNAIKELTGGIGTDRCIDAVGVDAIHPDGNKTSERAGGERATPDRQGAEEASEQRARYPWPRSAPSQVLEWAVESLSKAGTLSIVGVYPPTMQLFPIGMAMNKNLTVRMGNCNHRKYVPKLVELVRTGFLDPAEVLSQVRPLSSAIEAYDAFDRHEAGWMKVELLPGVEASDTGRVQSVGSSARRRARRMGAGSGEAGQSGDIQGLSSAPEGDSESVRELLEEGQTFEAEAVSGVENAPEPDEAEVRTAEVPEDDVPAESQQIE
jgi:threonine dehydrogenase-like Zn-dependent dehydrogenase